MGMSMRENGKMTRHMGMVNTFIWMGLNIQEIGRMINKMVKGRKFGQIKRHMKATIFKARNMVKVYLSGLMVQNIRENFTRITFMGLENISGKMVENM